MLFFKIPYQAQAVFFAQRELHDQDVGFEFEDFTPSGCAIVHAGFDKEVWMAFEGLCQTVKYDGMRVCKHEFDRSTPRRRERSIAHQGVQFCVRNQGTTRRGFGGHRGVCHSEAPIMSTSRAPECAP